MPLEGGGKKILRRQDTVRTLANQRLESQQATEQSFINEEERLQEEATERLSDINAKIMLTSGDIERWEFREICNVLKHGEDNPETPNLC